MAKETREHPVVDGVEYTFKALGTLLGITGSAAAAKYQRVKNAFGKVTMVAMRAPFADPKVTAQRQDQMLQREIDVVLRDARMHGATHAAMRHHMEPQVVRTLLEAANSKIAAQRATSVFAPKPKRSGVF